MCRMTPSSWAGGLSTPTFFVSQKRRKGYYHRIQDAVDEVPPSSRIEIVGGGTFLEKVTINKPIELTANRMGESPVISFRGVVMVVNASEVLLEGLSIQTESTMSSLVYAGGRGVVRKCRVRGLEVCGTACPTVEECWLGGAKGNSVHIRQKAGGSFFRNTIGNSGGFSILVESIGELNFSYNTVWGSHLGQVCVRSCPDHPQEDVKPNFTMNRITDDLAAAQVHLHKGSGAPPGDLMAIRDEERFDKPSDVKRTKSIFKLVEMPVKQAGMKVQLIPSKTSRFTINLEEDEAADPALWEDSVSGVLIQGNDVKPVFSRNTIAACKLHGLLLKAGASGTYEGNYFTANSGWAIMVEGTEEKAPPYFTHNQIASNGGGVRVCGCPATFEGFNVIFGNRGPQFFVDGGHEQLLIQHNMFRNCSRTAIWCAGPGGCVIARNSFESCAIGVRLDSLASASFSLNSFEGGSIGVIANGAQSTFTDCTFSDLEKAGVLAQCSGGSTFHRCSFFSCTTALQFIRGGGGCFSGCTIQDCRKVSVDVADSSNPTLESCIIRDGGGVGLAVSRCASGHFVKNQIFRHGGAAVEISENADPVLEWNLIGLSPCDGVVVNRGGCGLLVENIIYECASSGVVVSGPSTAPVLRHNFLLDCGRQGLKVTEGQDLLVCEKNVFIGSLRCHILVPAPSTSLEGTTTLGRTLLKEVHPVGGTKKREGSLHGTANTFSTLFSLNNTTKRSDARGQHSTTVKVRHLVIRNNFFWKSKWAGIIIHGPAHVALIGNTIANSRHGVLVYGEGHFVAIQNALDNCESGITLGEGSVADVVANTFQFISPGSAISTHEVLRASAAFNAIHSCSTGVYVQSAVGDVLVFGNLIREAVRFAVYQTNTVVKSTRLYHNILEKNSSDIYTSTDETSASIAP